MTSYSYRIYHDDEQCTKEERTRSALNSEQLEHEYDSIDMELHLYSRSKNTELSYDTKRSEQGGVLLTLRNFSSTQEADTFIEQFLNWLRDRLRTRFCPAIQREQA
jgi:hypothetical protein